MDHKNSKCLFFQEGVVFNEACDKVIAHCFCDIDEMEEDKPCTSDACRYYVRRKRAHNVRRKRAHTSAGRGRRQEGGAK